MNSLKLTASTYAYISFSSGTNIQTSLHRYRHKRERLDNPSAFSLPPGHMYILDTGCPLHFGHPQHHNNLELLHKICLFTDFKALNCERAHWVKLDKKIFSVVFYTKRRRFCPVLCHRIKPAGRIRACSIRAFHD